MLLLVAVEFTVLRNCRCHGR